MCGVICIDNRTSRLKLDFDKFVSMLKDNQDRGRDSTGVTLVLDGGVLIEHKVAGDPGKWLATVPTGFAESFAKARLVLAASRAQPVPEGDSSYELNRQPIRYHDWICVHNGTIGNDREIKAMYSIETRTEIDTEVALALLSIKTSGTVTEERVKSWASALSGGLTFFAYDLVNDILVVAKNFKPLVFATGDWGLVVWASERKTVEALGDFSNVRWVPPYTAFIQSPNNHFSIETFHESVLPEGDDRKALVVTSGGIDSSTAAYVAAKLHGKTVTLLHFDYGQLAVDREWEAVNAVADSLNADRMQVSLSWFGKLADTPLVSEKVDLPLGVKSVETVGVWVPARNLIMLAIAAGIAEAKGIGCIYSGFNLEESGVFSDNDIEFLKVFNLALQYGTIRHPRLVLALERIMKPEIVRLGAYLGVPFDKTWSCDRGFDRPCGECGCCWMRQFAFKKAGVPDRQVYLNPPRERVVWEGLDNLVVAEVKDILSRLESRGLDDLISLGG